MEEPFMILKDKRRADMQGCVRGTTLRRFLTFVRKGDYELIELIPLRQSITCDLSKRVGVVQPDHPHAWSGDYVGYGLAQCDKMRADVVEK